MQIPAPAAIGGTYSRVLGFAYQIVGDAALAAQASNTICLRFAKSDRSEIELWSLVVTTLRAYLIRGFVVQPLAASGHQAPLLAALHSLEPGLRMVLLLRYHERLAIEDVATVLDTDPREVRAQIALARRTILERS